MNEKPAGNDRHVLSEVARFIKRFVSLTDAQLIAIVLWVAHTHALEAAESTPYLSVTSAEKQCGKTRLLEVLSLLVAKPWFTGSATKAVLVRKFDAQQPTLLLDESDAAFAGDKEYSEALRAVLNNGHSREGVASLCVGQGTNITFKDFQVFCPKAIAGIGKLPDTVADRSIPIRMKRRAPDEGSERFRRRLLKSESTKLREQLASWVGQDMQVLRNATPVLPDLLSDRQQDGCEPLLAIADSAPGNWPQKARNALLELLTGGAAEDNSSGVHLLVDIRTVFNQRGAERLSTADLLAGLCDWDPQWLEFSRGKALSAAMLARMLKGFGILHRKLRLDDSTLWGYEREAFADAWVRYLPRRLEQVEQFSADADNAHFVKVEQGAYVPPLRNEESPEKTYVVPGVPPTTGRKQENLSCYIHGATTQWWERSLGAGDWLCEKCHPGPTTRRLENGPSRSVSAREIGFLT